MRIHSFFIAMDKCKRCFPPSSKKSKNGREETGIDEDDGDVLTDIDAVITELNELEGKGTEDTGAASGADDDDTRSENARGVISLVGGGTDDTNWDPNDYHEGRHSMTLNYCFCA